MPPTILTRGWGHVGDKWVNCVRRWFVPDMFDFTLPSIVSMENLFADVWYYALRSAASVSFRYEGFEWEYRDEDDVFIAGAEDHRYPGNGFSSGGIVSSQTAYLLQFLTGEDSPVRSRGLTYLPGVSDTWVDGSGLVNPINLGTLETVAEWLSDPGVDSFGRPWKGCVWRRSTKDAYPITGYLVNRRIATQRRRGLFWPKRVFPPWI